MKTILLIITLTFSSNVIAHGDANHNAIGVSIVQLISNPEKYHKKIVRVIGVANAAFEGNFICLSFEHHKYGVYKNCVWHSPNYIKLLATPGMLAKYNGKYVLMEGEFNMENNGHMGLSTGSLENVTRYELWQIVPANK